MVYNKQVAYATSKNFSGEQHIDRQPKKNFHSFFIPVNNFNFIKNSANKIIPSYYRHLKHISVIGI